MKLNLILSDSIYNELTRLAQLEDVDPRQLCSNIVVDWVFNKKPINKVIRAAPVQVSGNGPKKRVTVEQVLRICKYCWVDQMKFNDAVTRVASEFKREYTTVIDKCTRRISFHDSPLNTAGFVNLLKNPRALREHLCRRFPEDATEIAQRLDVITKENIESASAEITTLSESENEFTPLKLVGPLIICLKELGGSAPKPVVEKKLYEKFKDHFQTPHWQKLVGDKKGNGVPRWMKHVQFARNHAREMGLIKLPNESGRGMWELTEKGQQWSHE